MKLGSFCSGYGGLDLALAEVLDVVPAWHAENDPHAARVLAHHWPGIPNLGDITTVDWATVEPVDVVTAGFPCQPVSEAGRRAGVTDERWLFDVITDAVGRMVVRPRLLVFENVRGLLTANGGDAMARVVHGLARLGYVGSWRTLRASDVGAPHRRERVFVVAADADGQRLSGWTQPHEQPHGSRLAAPRRHDPGRLGSPAPDAAGRGLQDQSLGGNTTRQHERPIDRASRRDRPGVPAEGVRELGRAPTVVAWGPYEPAVRRWEHVLGRPAPAPTDAAGRLSPLFVEWLMGLPAGWVTAVPDVSRTAQLRILGNGVVPLHGAAALSSLLAHIAREAA